MENKLEEEKEFTTVIKPRTGLFEVNLKEIWDYRDLLTLFVKRDIIVQFNRKDVKTLEQAAKVLRDFPQGDRLTLGVLSTGLDKRNYLPVEIDVLPMN